MTFEAGMPRRRRPQWQLPLDERRPHFLFTSGAVPGVTPSRADGISPSERTADGQGASRAPSLFL